MTSKEFSIKDLIAKHYIEFDWPESDVQLRLTIANHAIVSKSIIEADKVYKDMGIGFWNIDDYEREKTLQMLYRVVSFSDGRSLGSITDFKQLMTEDLTMFLEDQHSILRDEHSPLQDNRGDDEFNKEFEEVKKNAEQTCMRISSIYSLRRHIISLVKLLPKSQTDS